MILAPSSARAPVLGCWFIVAGSALLSAQVDIGVSGGVPLTHFILDARSEGRSFPRSSSRVTSSPRRYTLGPFFEVRPWNRLGIEAGVLYKRFGFDLWSEGFTVMGGVPGPLITVNSTTTGNSVEFPVLAKVRVGLTPGGNLFLGAGPSVRRLFGIRERGERTVRTFLPPESTETTVYETDSPERFNRRAWLGLAMAAGLEFRAGPLRLAPGIRITRWDTSSAPAITRLAGTQAEVLLIIGLRLGPEARPLIFPRRTRDRIAP